MAITDWNGTTASYIGGITDWNGTTASQIKSVTDWNGTTASEIWNSELLIINNSTIVADLSFSTGVSEGINKSTTSPVKASVLSNVAPSLGNSWVVSNAFDVSGYDTMTITAKGTGNFTTENTGYNQFAIMLVPASATLPKFTAYNQNILGSNKGFSYSGATLSYNSSINISALNGSYKLYMVVASYNAQTTTMNVQKVILD